MRVGGTTDPVPVGGAVPGRVVLLHQLVHLILVHVNGIVVQNIKKVKQKIQMTRILHIYLLLVYFLL